MSDELEAIEREEDEDNVEEDFEEEEDEEHDLEAELEYEDFMSQQASIPPEAQEKKPPPSPTPVDAPPAPVDPALSADMCVMLKEQGNEHFKAGRYEAALRAYERAASHDPNNAHLWLNTAAALLKLNRPYEALWNSNRALVLTEGKNEKAWYRRATAIQALGYLSRALSDAAEARVLDPMDAATDALERQIASRIRQDQTDAHHELGNDESHWFDVINAYQDGLLMPAVFSSEEKLHLAELVGIHAEEPPPLPPLLQQSGDSLKQSSDGLKQSSDALRASSNSLKQSGDGLRQSTNLPAPAPAPAAASSNNVQLSEALLRALTATLFLLRTNETITDLDLSELPLHEIRLTCSLAEFLKRNKKVTHLNLAKTHLGQYGVYTCALALDYSPIPLTHLTLDHCYMTPVAASYLARYFHAHRKLVSLSLAYNSLREQGTIHLLRALPANSGLQNLSLVGNNITCSTSVEDFIILAKKLPQLTIDLSLNPLGQEHISAILKALDINTAKFKCDGQSAELSTHLTSLASPALLSAVAAAKPPLSGRPSADDPLY